jgi:hypothetical protein
MLTRLLSAHGRCCSAYSSRKLRYHSLHNAEEGEEDDHEGPGLITSRRPWQPGTLVSKISRTVRGGEEVARNVRKGCRTLDMMMIPFITQTPVYKFGNKRICHFLGALSTRENVLCVYNIFFYVAPLGVSASLFTFF